MKKTIALLLLLATVLTLASCSGARSEEFIDLQKGETLFIESTPYKNMTTTLTEKEYLTYLHSATYTLLRSSYAPTGEAYVKVGEYYYYFDTESVMQEEYLGTSTTRRTTLYSYLPYGKEDTSVALRTVTTTAVTFSYGGGEITKSFTYTMQLNGFYATEADVPAEILALVDTTGSKTYYVDVTVPEEKSQTVNTYNKFFRVEK